MSDLVFLGGGLSISISPGPATKDAAYSVTPRVSGANGTKSFALTGSPPSGTSFSTTTGTISGTPDTAGTTSGLIITVTAGGKTKATRPFSIVVSVVSATIGQPIGLLLALTKAA